jgi:hypothetical protein
MSCCDKSLTSANQLYHFSTHLSALCVPSIQGVLGDLSLGYQSPGRLVTQWGLDRTRCRRLQVFKTFQPPGHSSGCWTTILRTVLLQCHIQTVSCSNVKESPCLHQSCHHISVRYAGTRSLATLSISCFRPQGCSKSSSLVIFEL